MKISSDLRRDIKKANSRLRRLEKSGYDYYAYDIAKHYINTQLGTQYYSIRNIEDKYDLRLLKMSLKRFLSSVSSTVSGQKKLEKKRLKAFEEKGLTGTREEKIEFLRFLGEDGYKNLIDAIGYDATVFKATIESYNKHKDTERIERIYQAYLRNRDDYKSLIEGLRS